MSENIEDMILTVDLYDKHKDLIDMIVESSPLIFAQKDKIIKLDDKIYYKQNGSQLYCISEKGININNIDTVRELIILINNIDRVEFGNELLYGKYKYYFNFDAFNIYTQYQITKLYIENMKLKEEIKSLELL